MPVSTYPSSSGHRYHLYGVDCGGPSGFTNMNIDRYTEISSVTGGAICNCDHYHYPNNNDGDLQQLDGNEILRISTIATVTSNSSSHQISSNSRCGSSDNVSYLPYDKQHRPGGECSRCGSDIALMDPGRNKKKGNRKVQNQQQHYRGLHRQFRNDRKETMRTRRLLIIMGMFVAYVSAGAAIFNAIEAKPEQDRKQELKDFIEKFMESNQCVNRSVLVTLLQKAVVDSELVYHVTTNMTHLDRWDFTGSIGFVISVVTTIGFGNLSPFTMTGKAMCLVYAVFGIPLTVVMLRGMGEKMSRAIRRMRKCQNPVCMNSKRISRFVNLAYISLLGILVVVIGPALVFTYVEEWTFGQSLYFCFTTLSTIGFGDYIIGIHERRFTSNTTHEVYEMIAYLWIVFGLAYLAVVKCFLADLLLEKANAVERGTLKRLAAYFKGTPPTEKSSSSEVYNQSASPAGSGDTRRSRVQVVSSVSFPTDDTDASGENDVKKDVT